MPILEGSAGGQDSMRRAAMQYMQPQGASPQPGGVAPQADVAGLLSQATQLTLSTPDKASALAAWKQAILFLGEQLKAVQGGQQAPQSAPPGPSAFSQMGAQAVSPDVGRAPR